MAWPRVGCCPLTPFKKKLKPADVLKFCSKLDKKDHGVIRYDALEKIISDNITRKLRSAEMKKLIAHFDPDDDGSIDYTLFTSWLFTCFDSGDNDDAILLHRMQTQCKLLQKDVFFLY